MHNKVIIFDMDGVLFDTIPYAEKNTLEGYPGMTSAMYKELHSGNYHEELKKHASIKKEETQEEEENRRIAYAEKKKDSPLFEGIKELLNELHDFAHILVLNTNAFEKNCLPLLERADIKSLFDMIATADFSTDKVEKFEIIKEKYASHKSDTIFITDALGDVRDADIAGIPTVAVTWGVHDITFFNREKHHNLIAVINTVKELRGILLP
jgi:phosphoglycolate phosphatase-like HAD superfamily hydrolase